MRCSEFLNAYSEFVDDRLSPARHAVFKDHLANCPACCRYHRVLHQGVEECRSLPNVSPSPDFLPRLQHRLFHVDDAGRLTHRHPLGSAALVAVASVGFLALAWLPFATRMRVEFELPPVAVEVPGAPAVESGSRPAPDLFRGGPFFAPVTEYMEPLAPTLDGPSDFFMPFAPMVPVTPAAPPSEDVPLDSSLDGSR
jgi:hypothetical protein